MSSLQDTYTSSEEEDYVFEEPNKEVQHVAKKVEVKPVAKIVKKPNKEVQHVAKKVEVKPVAKKIEKYT